MGFGLNKSKLIPFNETIKVIEITAFNFCFGLSTSQFTLVSASSFCVTYVVLIVALKLNLWYAVFSFDASNLCQAIHIT